MYIFIVNPIAGSGKGKQLFEKLQKTSTYQAINAHFIYTKYRGHATEIALELSDSATSHEISAIIVVGGDGTVHEVLNGLEDKSIPISFLLGGSGNDFARGCSITGRPEEILKRVITGNNPVTYWPSTYDCGLEHERLFANSIGFGFDAVIAKQTNNSLLKTILNRFNLGKLSYAIVLIRCIINFKPLTFKVETEDGVREVNNCWIALASNHPYVGGGIKLVPKAICEKDKFTVILIHSISRIKVILLFATVFTGLHTHLKEVEQFSTNKISFEFNDSIIFQVDGEMSKARKCIITKQSNGVTLLGTI